MSHYPAGNLEEKPIVKRLRAQFPEAIEKLTDHRGDLAVWLPRDPIVDIARFLRDDPACDFNFLIDIAGADWLGREPRFDVVYHLYSLGHNHRLRLHVGVPEDDPTIDSVIGVWRGADWFERECYDLLGVLFRGHPFLRRILTHDDFQGHALRKDYDQRQRWRCTAVSDLESTVDVPAKAATANNAAKSLEVK